MPYQTTSSILENQIRALEPYHKAFLNTHQVQGRLEIINRHPLVQEFSNQRSFQQQLLKLTLRDNLAIKSMVAIGQSHLFFEGRELVYHHPLFTQFLKTLVEIDQFYEAIGGLLGYHLQVLQLICHQSNEESLAHQQHYKKPWGTNIEKEDSEIRNFIRQGLEKLPKMAEIYPVGGAGDRLNLKEEGSHEPLPAARLSFSGKSLLEGLIRDLQAREYLYYKLFHQQVITPIALMTSHEKNNHWHIQEICKEHQWFGRPLQSFMFFIQPLAPVITKEGYWAVSAPLTLLLKPGGHGVLWKLALDQGIFLSLQSQERQKALIRQINNPVAGLDYALLALAGLGFEKNKSFGFASCPRLLNTAEGMDVLLEKKEGNLYQYSISNIEYTEFAKKGIQDIASEPGSKYSAFPANTNILFADLKAVEKAVKNDPFPGRNINMKHQIPFTSPSGQHYEVEAGRLETTMQNISDSFVDDLDHPIQEQENDLLQTFLTYNERIKTISVTKKSYVPGMSLVETPEGAFYDLMKIYRNLLTQDCNMKVPEINNEADYLRHGPTLLVHLHPALGPLFSIIAQKICKGQIAQNSELSLEIAELELHQLNLKGSLKIIAEEVMGKKDAKGILSYSEHTGKCTLRNVTIENEGVDRSASHCFWKNEISHREQCSIILKGNGEFFAENVVFKGSHSIEVPDGQRVVAVMNERGGVELISEAISAPTWHWDYAFDYENKIKVDRTQGQG